MLVLFTKGIGETFENKAKEQKGGFLGKLLGTLGASLSGNLLTGKGVKWSKIPAQRVMQADQETIRAG